jgi:quercetin dioxygenase-like cupin family protein
MADESYQPEAYAGRDEQAVLMELRRDGWEPAVFANPPGFVYPPHRHPQAKLLAFLAGTMEVTVEGRTYRCAAGDKLVIPGNLEHAAVVGPEGCTFFWSEQLRNES